MRSLQKIKYLYYSEYFFRNLKRRSNSVYLNDFFEEKKNKKKQRKSAINNLKLLLLFKNLILISYIIYFCYKFMPELKIIAHSKAIIDKCVYRQTLEVYKLNKPPFI